MVTTQPAAFDISLADLLGALHDAFLDEFEDEELAALAVQTLVQERLLDGEWTFRAPRANAHPVTH